jgi:putative oxygen-independent coproporphyrinogen III oxidase
MTLAAASIEARGGAWCEDPGFGVYVHIPFCRRRCHYCDFNTYEGHDRLHGSYVDALAREIELRSLSAPPATSVFFGGGTPTLLPPAALRRVLDAIRSASGLAPQAEITVEANPETVDQGVFEELLAAGFNRFSVGVQSLVPHVLRGLGRDHPPEAALEALAAARRAGVDDLNADLIYGSVWESDDDWIATLTGVIEAGPDHVSAYALTVEEATPLGTLVATGRVADVDPDVQAHRYALAEESLGAAGYARYEISNWARPGRASRHNVLYWSAGDYLGFGAGAHGHVQGRRSWNVRLPREYIERVDFDGDPQAGCELLDARERASEAFMLGLRLSAGIDLEGMARRFGAAVLSDKVTVVTDLVERGLLVRSGRRVRLAAQATLVANDVLCRLL